MFGIGFTELVVIAIVALLALGPQRLPTLMRAAGRALREFRKATQELRDAIGFDDLMEGRSPSLSTRFDWREYPPEGPDAEGALEEEIAYAPAPPKPSSPVAGPS